VAPNLGPGEQILFEGHPSWRPILEFYFKGLLIVLLAAFATAGLTKLFDDEVNGGTVTLVAVIGVAIVLLVGFIKRIATSYTITNRRLHIKRGIISRDVQETRLERVQNVNFSQSVIQRVLQIGNVDFDTAAGDDYNFVFAGVAEPANVVERVDQATRNVGDGLGDERQPAAPPQQ
jgi:uncharacterized membrane protein YdbT with pleckstrin-like domain